ncbi:MAG: protein TolQ [Xanthomonadales bacterium]|nr:protein TolQ [Xanthomonadales bacterium]
MQIWELILQASWLVQAVMALLLVASVASWMIIFRKRQALKQAVKEADAFEERFWSGADLTQMHEGIAASHRKVTGMERIFETGFTEFKRMREQARMSAGAMVEGAQRAMRITLTRETEDLEHHLEFLATVGSTSPYIGLFGTVWGIMTSFHQLANVNQATIAMVAPGISEALIATAMGLFAAIPAVIAFNRFSNQVERLEVRYDNFKEEFSSILEREAHRMVRD